MRRWIAVALLVGLASRHGIAADPVKPAAAAVPLHAWREVWKAGDVATITTEETTHGKFHSVYPDPNARLPHVEDAVVDRRLTAKRVVRCLEADGRGAPTRYLVHVAEWTLTEADQPEDKSLAGLHLLVRVVDGHHAFEVLTRGAKPSAEGRQWLDRRFGEKRRAAEGLELDHLGRPPGPVEAGGSWKGDAKTFASDLPIKPDESSVTCTLTGVEEGSYVLGVAVKMRLSEFPLEGTSVALPYTEGGTYEGEGEARHALEAGRFEARTRFTARMSGKASRPEVGSVQVGLEFTSTMTATTGGDMPPVPGTKPPEPSPAAPVK